MSRVFVFGRVLRATDGRLLHLSRCPAIGLRTSWRRIPERVFENREQHALRFVPRSNCADALMPSDTSLNQSRFGRRRVSPGRSVQAVTRQRAARDDLLFNANPDRRERRRKTSDVRHPLPFAYDDGSREAPARPVRDRFRDGTAKTHCGSAYSGLLYPWPKTITVPFTPGTPALRPEYQMIQRLEC